MTIRRSNLDPTQPMDGPGPATVACLVAGDARDNGTDERRSVEGRGNAPASDEQAARQAGEKEGSPPRQKDGDVFVSTTTPSTPRPRRRQGQGSSRPRPGPVTFEVSIG